MTAFFLQQLINGLTLGAVYGLIAIGYTMVYGIIGMINFAHGEVYMVSAYLCAIGLALLSFFGIHSFPLLIFATLVFTIVVTGVYGWAIERIAYRPLRNSTRLAPLISAIGMSLILQNYVQLSQGPNQQGIPTLFSGALRMTVGDGVVQITWTKVFILVAALVGMLILTWIIQYTRLGRICRATQQDRRMAAILGINTDRVISLVFVIGAAMAGLAGEERRGQRAMTLSGGEQQMLAIARALMSRPRLLLLDEPSLGLAPLVVKQIFQILRELTAQGMTLFLVEQNARHALNLSDRAYVMVNGQIRLSGSGQTLLNDPEVRKAYLGISG
ncbi:TPA: ATP-binding cassette domain-containing protein [Klebsiella pneumoniae]|nr:ATP-binding cassette domain-containing protein [Klebsiella pneumoniae]HBY0449437.1 ATP-binding cassette domain-containing protein [Klebsiella pneumoniae subsp. pneumoniae]